MKEGEITLIEQLMMLRSALVAIIGADGREDLAEMELFIRQQVAPTADKAAAIDGIHALVATLDHKQ